MKRCAQHFAALAVVLAASAPAANAAPIAPLHTQSPVYITAAAGPNLLGTSTVPIRAQRFNSSWSQAMQDSSRSPLLQRIVAPARNLTKAQQLLFVQSRVHNNIRWISDATEWGKHDYWASASETLAHGAGDMEDRAIVKMHALRALGHRPGDLFLTMGRDQVGGPVTVLVVRLGNRFHVLDDTGGSPFLIEARQKEFKPLLSFGTGGVWAHTAPVVLRPIATAAAASFGRK
jgi:predicted transglutaminase-like cysteine proteinase